MKNELLTQKETAKLLRISYPTFIKLRREGAIPFYRSGRKYLFSQVEVLAALKEINL